jgi:YD repeat-containing protein
LPVNSITAIWQALSGAVQMPKQMLMVTVMICWTGCYMLNSGFKDRSWIKTIKDYTVSRISYDLNGNLKNMWQRGDTSPGLPSDIDKLKYTYQTGTNRLIKVEDAGANVASYPDFKNNATNTEEYDYDANGNMIRDDNKNITTIAYNYLNKPGVITTSQGTLYYVYDALGNLLENE